MAWRRKRAGSFLFPGIQGARRAVSPAQCPVRDLGAVWHARLLSLWIFVAAITDPTAAQQAQAEWPLADDPMVYVNVPSESLERIEFIRGGAALLYGPQPAGALNYVTRQPEADVPFQICTRHTAGSHGLYATHDEVTGTVDGIGYLAEFYQRHPGNERAGIRAGLRCETGRHLPLRRTPHGVIHRAVGRGSFLE